MLPQLQDDGLLTPEVGPWAERKYRLVSNYARTFATGMKDKWDCRAYVDLFAGTGRSRIKDTGAIIPASPILALDIPDRFDRYIFCDINKAALEALETRVKRIEPSGDYRFIVGDINQSTEKILAAMPQGSRERTALTFCLVDPFDIQNLHFDTIRAMAQRYVDFLVLIPSYMDAHRNEAVYTSCGNKVLDLFLGNTRWRSHWEREK